MPIGGKVELAELEKLKKRIGPEKALRILGDSLFGYTPALLRALGEESPARTGFFRRNWRVDPGPTSIQVRNPTRYAWPLVRGVKPSMEPVTPVRKRALRWRTRGRGPISAARTVVRLATGRPGARHPRNFQFAMSARPFKHGRKANPVISRAFEKSIGFFRDIFVRTARKAIGAT